MPPGIRARDVMTVDPLTVRPNDSLLDALLVIRDRGVGFVPVVDEARRLIGVLTDRDAALALASDRRASEIRVEAMMTRNPVTCGPEDDLFAYARLMEEFQVRRIPVVDQGGILLGVVATGDIFRRAARRRDLESEVPRLMEAIVQPC